MGPCIEELVNMGFKSFKINVIVRLGIILILLSLSIYYILVEHKYLRAIYAGIAFLVTVVELFWYIDKRNREINLFLSSLLSEDFSLTFSDLRKGKSFRSLYETMNSINSKFEKLRSEREVHSQYLLLLVEHIKVGIISFDSSHKIHLVNQAFKDLFNLQGLGPNSSLEELGSDYTHILSGMKPDENIVKKFPFPGGYSTLALQATVFKLENEDYKLISAQNIKEELEEQEVLAWQKLIRVLTHEIMNSVTPISSLSSSLHSLVTKNAYDDSVKSKLVVGLEAIINRSEGLMKFTEAYKSLSRIPPPVLKPVKSDEFMLRVEKLCSSINEKSKVDISTYVGPDPWVFYIDLELFDNVIINLVKNAMESMKENKNPKIKISLIHSRKGKTVLEIKDYGSGMKEEVKNEIFVPFYTTKREGTGIGLSISNQIVRSHGGTISVESTLNKGSTFKIII